MSWPARTEPTIPQRLLSSQPSSWSGPCQPSTRVNTRNNAACSQTFCFEHYGHSPVRELRGWTHTESGWPSRYRNLYALRTRLSRGKWWQQRYGAKLIQNENRNEPTQETAIILCVSVFDIFGFRFCAYLRERDCFAALIAATFRLHFAEHSRSLLIQFTKLLWPHDKSLMRVESNDRYAKYVHIERSVFVGWRSTFLQ